MKKYISKIWELYKPFRITIIFLFALTLLIQIVNLLPPIIYARLIDSIFAKISLQRSLFLAAWVFLLEILSLVFYQIKSRLEIKYTDFDVSRFIYSRNLNKILSFSIGQNMNENSGVKQNILDRGSSSIEQATVYTLFQAAPLFFKVLSAVIAMLIINLILGGVVLTGVISYAVFSFYINGKFKKPLKKQEEMYNDLGKEYTEVLWNIPTIKINSQEELSQKIYNSKYSKICEFGKSVWTKYMNNVVFRDSIGVIASFIIMFLGVIFVFNGQYTPGTLLIFWSWSSRALDGLGDIGQMQRQYMEWSASIKKYFNLMDMEPDIKEAECPVKLKDIKGRIEFKNVFFQYPYRRSREEENDRRDAINRISAAKEDIALKGVSFKIESGQKVAFVGESGDSDF